MKKIIYEDEDGFKHIALIRDCDPDTICRPDKEAPVFDEWTHYIARLERADSLDVFRRYMQVGIESDVRGEAKAGQGRYRIWFCMLDPKGMPGHFIGPVIVNSGELCP